MLAIDLSDWTVGVPDQATVGQMHAAGYELGIVCLWHGRDPSPLAGQQLAALTQGGLLTAGYVGITGAHDGQWHIDRGCEAISKEQWAALRFVAVDVEVEGITLDTVRQAVARVAALNQRPIIYTGAWFWQGELGDPHDFAALPLWTAQYDDVADLSKVELYGGWTLEQVAGKQISGNSIVAGLEVDVSIFRDSFVTPEDKLTPEVKASLVALKAARDAAAESETAMTAALSQLWNVPVGQVTELSQLEQAAPGDVKAAATAYGEHLKADRVIYALLDQLIAAVKL